MQPETADHTAKAKERPAEPRAGSGSLPRGRVTGSRPDSSPADDRDYESPGARSAKAAAKLAGGELSHVNHAGAHVVSRRDDADLAVGATCRVAMDDHTPCLQIYHPILLDRARVEIWLDAQVAFLDGERDLDHEQ